MKRFVLKMTVVIFCNLIYCQLRAQTITVNTLIGVWRGTSLCQVKNSPCHDEVVVYHIKNGNTSDSCVIQANKIVNGVEEDMGILLFKLDGVTNELVSLSSNAKWVFKLQSGKLEGTLTHQGTLFRIIELAKVK